MQGPLEGIKVLDLTRVLAGPYCCMLLGDMGAEVVKVERTGRGDDVRAVAPKIAGESTYFLVMNRNKKGITLNFRHPKANDLLLSLIKKADVLVENFRAGTLEAMGLDWETLKQINPRLVVTRISGFGQDGPYKDRTCYDVIAQALSGLMDMTGEADGAPMMAGTFVVDYATALYATIGTLAALRAREITGVGQVVDVALLDTAVSHLITAIPDYLRLGQMMTRRGNQDRYAWPCNLYKGEDGRWVYVSSGNDTFFPILCKVMEKEELLQDPRFANLEARAQHIEESEEIVRQWVATKTADEVVDLVGGAGIPCAKVNTIADMVENPQVRHRGMIAEIDHPTAGKVPVPGPSIHFSDTKMEIRQAPPLLGQHNEEVYTGWLGLSPSEVAQLRSEGVI